MIQQFKHKKCHTEGRHILTLNNCKLYASSNKQPYIGYQLIINLSGYSHTEGFTATPHRGAGNACARFLAALPKPKHIDPPELEISWRDGDVPALSMQDWEHLIKDFEHFKGRVLVHCIGGHGRTGTFCAILLALTGALRKDPVQWLRKNYCEKAVETKRQFDYLSQLGITTTCEPKPLMASYSQAGMWRESSFLQEQYNLTKPSTVIVENVQDFQPLYQCLMCKRSRTGSSFHQVFADMTGMCHQCNTAILCDAKNVREYY